MTDSKFITFDKVFDTEEIRKELYKDTKKDPNYYDEGTNPKVKVETSYLISKHIDDLSQNIKYVEGDKIMGISQPSYYTLKGNKEKNIEELISLFYLFPFSNSKIKPSFSGSTSELIKKAPIKDDVNNKILYFESPGKKPEGSEGKKGTITSKDSSKKTYKILIGDTNKSEVKKDQLIFLERTTEGANSQYLDKDVYKQYIKIHGKEVVELLKSLKDKSFEDAKKIYVDFVKKTDFKGVSDSDYMSNRFSDISKNNVKEDKATSPATASDSPEVTSGATPGATPGTTKGTNLNLDCNLTDAKDTTTTKGGRKRGRKTRRKTNKRKRRTLKKRKTKKAKKTRKNKKTKRVRFRL